MAPAKAGKTKNAKRAPQAAVTGKGRSKAKAAPRKAAPRKAAPRKAAPRKAGGHGHGGFSKPAAKRSAKRAAKPTSIQLAQGAQQAVVKALRQKPVPAPAPARPAGMPEMLRDAALAVLNERQAEDVLTFDLAERSAMADYLVIASGRASKQLAAIAHYLGEAFVKLGVSKPRIEGLQDANWVLVDAGDVIVHLFRPEVRKYYDLERIWQEK